MTLRGALLITLTVLATLVSASAQSQDPVSLCERMYDAERSRTAKLLDDLMKTMGSDATCKGKFEAVVSDNQKYKDGLRRGEALKIAVQMKHDHERFVLGAPFSLRIHIINQSATDSFYFRYSDIQVHIPKALTVGPDPEQDAKTQSPLAGKKLAHCFPLHQGAENGGYAKSPVDRDKEKASSLEAIPPSFVVIPASGSHTVVWECGPVGYSPLNPLSWPDKIAFRPDEYTFIVNIPFHDSDDPSKPAFSQKAAEIAIDTGLDSIFIAVCAAVGAIFATIVRFQFRRIELKSNSERYTKKELRFFQSKNIHDLASFLIIGMITTPLFISAANATQKFDQFISIQIFDTFGAVLSGFLFHTIVIRFGEPAIDWFFKRIFGTPERDIVNWH